MTGRHGGRFFAWTVLAANLIAAGPGSLQDERSFRDFLLESTRMLADYRAKIDASEFDLDACAKARGASIESLFEYVRDEIAYEPYEGILRGARGCLESGAGNAADKSLLLAELLKRAGHPSRFARGRLERAQAEDLVIGSLLWEPGDEDVDVDFPYGFDTPELVEERRAAAEAVASRLRSRFDRLRATIEGVLGERLKGPGGDPLDVLASEAEEHVWVQAKAGDRWIDLDPSVFLAEPGEALATAASTPERLPEEWVHRVTFRGIVETYDAGKVTPKTLFEQTYPAWELSGLPVVYSCSSELEPAAVFGERLAGKNSRCLRLYVGGRRVHGVNFDCVPPGGGGGPLRLPDLFGAGTAAAPAFVAGVAAEVQVAGPRGKTPPHRRALLDYWGFKSRAANDTGLLEKLKSDPAAQARLDNRVLCFGVQTGALRPSLVQARGLDLALAKLQSFRIANGKITLHGGAGDQAARLFPDAFIHLNDRLGAALIDRRSFAASPRLFLAQFDVDGTSTRFAFDVTHDVPRFLALGSGDPRRAAMEGGLLAAVVEEELTFTPLNAGRAGATPTAAGSAQALESSLGRGPPRLIEAEAGLPATTPDAEGLMRTALRRGRLLIVPAGERPTAWFEFDPASGLLEATVESGLHQAATERTSIEAKTPGKTVALTRMRDVIREITRCVAQNVDELIEFAAGWSGGLPVENVVDGIRGAAECLAKCKKGKVGKGLGKRPDRTQKWKCGPNAKKLRESMKNANKPVKGLDAHHIVPSTHPKGFKARSILEKYGIDVNHAANGIGLTKKEHSGLHTFKYIDWVTNKLAGCKSKEEVVKALDEIGQALKKSGPRPF